MIATRLDTDTDKAQAVARFNALVERFDKLTLGAMDRCNVLTIRNWLWCHDPGTVSLFDETARVLGYAIGHGHDTTQT